MVKRIVMTGLATVGVFYVAIAVMAVAMTSEKPPLTFESDIANVRAAQTACLVKIVPHAFCLQRALGGYTYTCKRIK